MSIQELCLSAGFYPCIPGFIISLRHKIHEDRYFMVCVTIVLEPRHIHMLNGAELMLSKYLLNGYAVVAHTFNPSPRETGGSL